MNSKDSISPRNQSNVSLSATTPRSEPPGVGRYSPTSASTIKVLTPERMSPFKMPDSMEFSSEEARALGVVVSGLEKNHVLTVTEADRVQHLIALLPRDLAKLDTDTFCIDLIDLARHAAINDDFCSDLKLAMDALSRAMREETPDENIGEAEVLLKLCGTVLTVKMEIGKKAGNSPDLKRFGGIARSLHTMVLDYTKAAPRPDSESKTEPKLQTKSPSSDSAAQLFSKKTSSRGFKLPLLTPSEGRDSQPHSPAADKRTDKHVDVSQLSPRSSKVQKQKKADSAVTAQDILDSLSSQRQSAVSAFGEARVSSLEAMLAFFNTHAEGQDFSICKPKDIERVRKVLSPALATLSDDQLYDLIDISTQSFASEQFLGGGASLMFVRAAGSGAMDCLMARRLPQ